jgi:adhesin transport system membrane fusion protein
MFSRWKSIICNLFAAIRKKFSDLCLKCKNWRSMVERTPPSILPEDEDFIADSKAALMNRITPVAHMITYCIVIFILTALVWSYFAVIDQSTTGEGKVIPSSEVKVIQSLDGGIVDEMLVQEGQLVKQGQPLVHLDETRYKADYGQYYSRYVALLAQVARLSAETRGDSQISFPEIIKNKQPELIARERGLFSARRGSLKDQLSVAQKGYELANKNVEMLAPLAEKGIVAKVDLIRAQRDANDMKGKILEIQEKFREDAWTELNLRESDLNSLTENLNALRDKMVRTILTSPVNGVIKKINIHTIGGVVQPGMDILEVVPIEDTLLVEAHVLPADIGFIRVGEPATVRVSAYDYSIYGLLKGKVEYVSADAIEDTKPTAASAMSGGGGTYYLVNVRTKQNYLQRGTEKLPIIPGMTASVQIKTGNRTILQYILKPLLKAKQEALQEK